MQMHDCTDEDNATRTRRLAAIRDELRPRLGPVCSYMPERQFYDLIARMAERKLADEEREASLRRIRDPQQD